MRKVVRTLGNKMFRKTFLYSFVLFSCLFSVGKSGLASTWSSCECHWESWRSWSSCNKTCGGGQQSRERWVWHRDVPECDGFTKCATTDMAFEYRRCNALCFNGGNLIDTGVCSCTKGFKGTCCEEGKGYVNL